jgi:hypothetical protein
MMNGGFVVSGYGAKSLIAVEQSALKSQRKYWFPMRSLNLSSTPPEFLKK